MDEYVAEELADARRALSDANVLSAGTGSKEAVVNRLYYACFHPATTVLYARGIEPKTHRGVVNQFGKEIVRGGDATKSHGRFLNEMRTYRQTTDYEHGPIEADVDALFEQTETFVTDVEALL